MDFFFSFYPSALLFDAFRGLRLFVRTAGPGPQHVVFHTAPMPAVGAGEAEAFGGAVGWKLSW